MIYFLLAIILILIVFIGYLYRQLRFYRKQHDYYVSVDEENERLRVKLSTFEKPLAPVQKD